MRIWFQANQSNLLKTSKNRPWKYRMGPRIAWTVAWFLWLKKLWFMVDITNYNYSIHGGYFMVYKPTFTSLGGGPSCKHSLMDIQLAAGMGHGCPVGWLASRWIEQLRQLSICGIFWPSILEKMFVEMYSQHLPTGFNLSEVANQGPIQKNQGSKQGVGNSSQVSMITTPWFFRF